MAIRDIFKISRKTFFNPTSWLDVNFLATQNRTILDVFRNMFSPPQPLREETFEMAMKRLHLKEKDVQNIAKNYRYYSLFFLLIGAICFFYTFYLLFRYGTLTGWMLGMAISVLFFSQAFRYDFWSLQMRKRKLGLTFDEWKKSVLGGKEVSK